MEFITLIIVAGVIWFVVSLRKSSSTSNRPIAKNIQKDADPLGSTVSQAGFGIGALYILDEIIDGHSHSLVKQDKQAALSQLEDRFIEEDCFEDDFEFFE